jgi:hypothetical protein
MVIVAVLNVQAALLLGSSWGPNQSDTLQDGFQYRIAKIRQKSRRWLCRHLLYLEISYQPESAEQFLQPTRSNCFINMATDTYLVAKAVLRNFKPHQNFHQDSL